MSEQEYCLYIFLDESDAPLYCGITKDDKRRHREHMTQKPWAHDVASVLWLPLVPTCPTISSREHALRVEETLIKLIKPKHNVLHNAPRLIDSTS